MTLEQLRIFVAVALREHVTQAARDLNLTQSATSAAIAALEQRHATRLFHRVGRRILLTEEGRIFLAEAKAVLARAAHAEAILDELAGLKRGSLVVKASQTIASHWLPGYLVRLKQAHPGLDIRLSVGNTAQVARAVRAGEVEIGFVEGEVDLPELETRVVGHDRLAVVVACDHPTGPDGAAPALGALDWILREEGSGTRSEFEKILPAFGIDPARLRVMLELPSNEAVRAAVEAGGGATALSELAAEAGLKAGTLRRLDYQMPRRPFFAVKSRDVEPSRAVAALLALMGPLDDEAAAAPPRGDAAVP